MPKTIVFIHGAFMTPKCWAPFRSFFEAEGYRVLAPAWPYKDRSVEEQRAHPDPRLGTLGIGEIVAHYEDIIRRESEPPILIGHSFGGLFVQMLLDRGLGEMGIAIDSAPPRGVLFFALSAFRSVLKPLVTPLGWRRAFQLSFKDFRYAFAHTAPIEAVRIAYDAQVVPESGRIFWQTALAPFNHATEVSFSGRHQPLLLIAGEEDHICPAGQNRATYEKYRLNGREVDLKVFPHRTHWLITAPGWEEIAQYALQWIRSRSASG